MPSCETVLSLNMGYPAGFWDEPNFTLNPLLNFAVCSHTTSLSGVIPRRTAKCCIDDGEVRPEDIAAGSPYLISDPRRLPRAIRHTITCHCKFAPIGRVLFLIKLATTPHGISGQNLHNFRRRILPTTRPLFLICWSFPATNEQNRETCYRYPHTSPHSGILSCFFHGFSNCFVRSLRSPSAIRRRVEWGWITSSI